MKFRYELVEEDEGWVAECLEADVMGNGQTADEAVEALREALQDRLSRPDATAPPEHPVEAKIELEPATQPAPGHPG